MSWKSRVPRLEGYFYEVDVWSPKSAKRVVWSPKYAIFSANKSAVTLPPKNLGTPHLSPRGRPICRCKRDAPAAVITFGTRYRSFSALICCLRLTSICNFEFDFIRFWYQFLSAAAIPDLQFWVQVHQFFGSRLAVGRSHKLVVAVGS